MVLDSFCGHRLMIWRPSDMVLVACRSKLLAKVWVCNL
jgi:hypothetical protein